MVFYAAEFEYSKMQRRFERYYGGKKNASDNNLFRLFLSKEF